MNMICMRSPMLSLHLLEFSCFSIAFHMPTTSALIGSIACPCPGLRKFRQWPGQQVDSLSLGLHHPASERQLNHQVNHGKPMVNPCKPNAINHAQVGLMNWDDLKWPQMVGIWLVTGMVYGICLTTLLITDGQVRKFFSALWITNSSVIWDSRLNRLHAIRWRRCFVDVGWPCRWRRCSLVTKHCWWFMVILDICWSRVHQDTWLLGWYGDRSRWRGPLFWSFLNNLNTHQICRNHPISTIF